MKTREQNRNNKRTEIERFDWFVERIQTLVAFGWLSECSGEKNFIPENFPEINRYFALTSYLNTICQSNSPVSTCIRENKESLFFDKTNNEHLPKPFFEVIGKPLYRSKVSNETMHWTTIFNRFFHATKEQLIVDIVDWSSFWTYNKVLNKVN